MRQHKNMNKTAKSKKKHNFLRDCVEHTLQLVSEKLNQYVEID